MITAIDKMINKIITEEENRRSEIFNAEIKYELGELINNVDDGILRAKLYRKWLEFSLKN